MQTQIQIKTKTIKEKQEQKNGIQARELGIFNFPYFQ